jgi:PEP-CTERM motif
MRKWSRAVVAAAIGLVGLAGPATATNVFVSRMSLPYYEIVDLAGGRLGTQHGIYAGQQILTANNGSTYGPLANYTLYAWCVDFSHEIYIGADSINYTLAALTDDHSGATSAASVPWSAATAPELAGLAMYGNSLMQAAPSNLISAALQVALWNIEYGSDYAGSDTALAAEVSDLMALAPSLNTTGVLLDSFDPSGIHYQSQSLMFPGFVVAEPGTIALLTVGLLGVALVLRRKLGIRTVPTRINPAS